MLANTPHLLQFLSFFTWFSDFPPTFFSLNAESCDLKYHCCRENQFVVKSPRQSHILLTMVMTLRQDGQDMNYKVFLLREIGWFDDFEKCDQL